MLLAMLPTATAAAQQRTDINKPTRERVKEGDKKKKDNKANDNKKDVKPAASAPSHTDKKDEKPVANKSDEKPAANNSAQTTENKSQLSTADKNYNGLDVSKHQGVINWDVVKKDSKIQYVFIKATEGSNVVDEKYRANIQGARRVGIKVGSYHYLTNKSSATTQFENFARTALREEQDLLPVIDVEVCKQWTPQQLRDSLKVFAEMVEDYYGCKPVIYTYESFYKNYLGKAFADYPIFIAKYCRTPEGRPNINVNWILWQYSESGRVNGINTYVDLSRFNKGRSISDILYRPKGKPKMSVKDAVDRNKPKPTTVNMTEQTKQTKQSERQREENEKKAARKKQAEERNKKMAADNEKAKADKAKADKAKADKAKADREKAEKAKAEKAKAEKEKERQKAAKAKADREKAEKAKADKAKAEAEAKAKRKAEAKKAREAKANQSKTNKSASLLHSSSSDLSKSQRNDSIRTAKNKGRKINKSSADND
jgi:lysozyme